MLTTGLIVVTLGQILRSTAMITAASNFSHLIQYSKAPEHSLVRSGIYAWSRHPSYFAFFYWALGTQILVGNPVAFVAFFFILYRFFESRIKGKFQILTCCVEQLMDGLLCLVCPSQPKNGTLSSSSDKITSSTRRKCPPAFRSYLSNASTP